MTTIALRKTNLATKQSTVIAKYKVTYARQHGRPRGRGRKQLKIRKVQ